MARRKVHPVRPDDDLDSLPPWPEDVYAPRRRRAGGWIMAICMVSAVGLVALAAERRYHVVALVTRPAPPQSKADDRKADDRLESFLTNGERALSEGDLDGA